MAKITVTTDIDLNIEVAAKWFAGLTDDDMCQFLVAVAEESQGYRGGPDGQWYYLGGHLRNCECSTQAARDMVLRWAYWIEHSEHGQVNAQA